MRAEAVKAASVGAASVQCKYIHTCKTGAKIRKRVHRPYGQYRTGNLNKGQWSVETATTEKEQLTQKSENTAGNRHTQKIDIFSTVSIDKVFISRVKSELSSVRRGIVESKKLTTSH